MKVTHYTQCVFTRPTESGQGYHSYVAWIPAQFAKKNKLLSLKFERDGKEIWQDWTVADVGTTKDAKLVETHERDYLTQRKASDI